MCELKVENLAVVGGVALGYEVRVTATRSRQRSHEYNYTLRGMWYSAAQLQLTVILLHNATLIYTGENPACERRYHHSQSYLELCVEF